jgi:hypothetical protein
MSLLIISEARRKHIEFFYVASNAFKGWKFILSENDCHKKKQCQKANVLAKRVH